MFLHVASPDSNKYKMDFIMEPDRYQQNHLCYIIGLMCLVLCLSFFGVSAYIFPRIAFDLHYNIPSLLSQLITQIQISYSLSENTSGWIVLLILISCAFVFLSITYIASSRIDNEIYAIKSNPSAPSTEDPTTKPFVFKMLGIIGLVFVIAKFFQWAISTNQ